MPDKRFPILPIRQALTNSTAGTLNGNPPIPTNGSGAVTSIPSNGKGSDNGKLGGGPIVGIAIACVIIGIAIGCLLVYYFFVSRRKWRHDHSRHINDGMDGRNGSAMPGEKSLASVTISIPQDSSAAIVENALPQPVEDNAIKTELSKLKDRVSDHIQSYYDLTKMRGSVTPLDVQQVLGNQSSVTVERFLHLLADPKTRPTILRYGLAWVILSRVSLECDQSISFLPWHIVSCFHEMLLTKMSDRGELDIDYHVTEN